LQAVGGLAALLVAVVLARKIHLRAKRPEHATMLELASGGAPIALFFVAIAVQPFIDAMVLAALAPTEVVGWYGAARNIMALLCAPALILGTASFPQLSRVAHLISDLRRELRVIWRLLLGLGSFAAVGTFLFADVAVSLIYGRGHFDPASVVLQVFAPILPLLFVDMLLGNAITAVGKTKEIAIVKVVSVAISTGLALVLIPLCQARFGNGGIGLIVAFGLAEVLMLAALLWLLPPGVMGRSEVSVIVSAAVSACGTMAIFWTLPSMTPWLALPSCVAAFIGLAFATGLVRKADFNEISLRLR
jgi:O-antigen/teichoic acid export membrane protein